MLQINMKLVIQRVSKGDISYSNYHSTIGIGYVVLCGFLASDNTDVIRHLLNKLIKLRIFEDENGKMNKSIVDVQGDIMFVPNFTLYADASGSNRPSFSSAAPANISKPMYQECVDYLKSIYPSDKLVFGEFGADMLVNISNDGPVTLILEEN